MHELRYHVLDGTLDWFCKRSYIEHALRFSCSLCWTNSPNTSKIICRTCGSESLRISTSWRTTPLVSRGDPANCHQCVEFSRDKPLTVQNHSSRVYGCYTNCILWIFDSFNNLRECGLKDVKKWLCKVIFDYPKFPKDPILTMLRRLTGYPCSCQTNLVFCFLECA
jgi:hypothetical protein